MRRTIQSTALVLMTKMQRVSEALEFAFQACDHGQSVQYRPVFRYSERYVVLTLRLR
jgi:hypothetical protein